MTLHEILVDEVYEAWKDIVETHEVPDYVGLIIVDKRRLNSLLSEQDKDRIIDVLRSLVDELEEEDKMEKVIHECGGELEVYVYDYTKEDVFYRCKRCHVRFDETELPEQTKVVSKVIEE